MEILGISLGFLSLLSFSLAQFPPTPSGLSIVNSKVNEQVKISYKETDICEKTPGVKSYSGFVHLPGSLLNDTGGFDINAYFLYFESRHNASTAPLAIYLAGGPGESSIYTALASESGPCYVNVNSTDTIINPWSFNNYVNMLYIDQPVQSGFSYDILANGTFDLEQLQITPEDFGPGSSSLPATNASFGVGTYSSQSFANVTNTTGTSARALWHFSEHWFSSFPEYNTSSNKLGIWGNSYGGFWAPETATVLSKNLKALPPKHPLKSKNLTVDTLGITNGCMDFLYAMDGFPDFAYNNTYDVHFLPEDVYHEALDNITKPDGCTDMIKACRESGDVGDPDFMGSNATVNAACQAAFEVCQGIIFIFDEFNNRSNFDVAVHTPDPCMFYLPVHTYLNRADVQSSLGVPLNFTWVSNLVTAIYGFPTPYDVNGTGDSFRVAGLEKLEYLIENDVKISLVFGDRDYRCPWTGGEATAKAVKWEHQKGFLSAGYQEIQGIVSPGANGGVVKQYGKLSFSRIFDAGHAVSAYAPEAVYRVFMRSMFGEDVATGERMVDEDYHTTGPTDSWRWRNKLPQSLPETCMVEGNFTRVNPWAAILGTQ